MKSEFDKYLDLTYISILNGNFCLEKGKYIQNKSIGESIEKIENLDDKTEEIASQAIKDSDLDTLKKTENINLDFISSKLKLCLIGVNYQLN